MKEGGGNPSGIGEKVHRAKSCIVDSENQEGSIPNIRDATDLAFWNYENVRTVCTPSDRKSGWRESQLPPPILVIWVYVVEHQNTS